MSPLTGSEKTGTGKYFLPVFKGGWMGKEGKERISSNGNELTPLL